ncbi:MAG: Gfo/Idh/MocA family oxidoreductase [Phenylobacterium sp.]|uniref:Gfo/Idh/MocA family protein n=1 Tax=Phenylobacterium sp. TaxID=1871053 RepID=UPI0027357514|nr:Gfo/Idh/MocA family oxidoreductase [Phenylobacterium sp.]MDP3174713.1 Gfo/Idh/MocA family oxidoreductase [Phenylobacterium sp.]
MVKRVAIAGLGRAARAIHLPALRKLPNLECVGGFDLQRPEEGFGFPLFDSVEALLAQTRPDMLFIVTPPDSHFALTKLGLEAGCHVFCEKPLAERIEDAEALAELARAAGRHVVVNSEFPWMPIHSAAKRRMAEPGFGKLQFITLQQTFIVTPETEEGWRGLDPQRTFKEFGTHVLDLAQYFFDAAPISIRARMPRPAGPSAPDHLNIVELEFSGERMALILLDRLSPGRHRYLDIRLDGTEAIIETSIGGRLQAAAGLNTRTRKPFVDVEVAMGGTARLFREERMERLATAPIDLFPDATARLLTDVLAAIERGETPPCALEHSTRTLRLLAAAYESAADGGSPRAFAP